MKKNIITVIVLALSISGFAQGFTPSWHIIQPNAQYSILSAFTPSAMDTSDGVFIGSVVLAYDFINGNFLCYDPDGRIIAFKGQSSLLKAPITPNCGIGIMRATKQLMDGTDVDSGSYVWITNWDGKKTITVQEGKTIDLADNEIELLPYRKDARNAKYKSISNN